MLIKEWQDKVDLWIREVGVRYFDIKTNTLLLVEEVGEIARSIARVYGEQSFKESTPTHDHRERLKDELGDAFFVLTCMANQLDMDLSEILSNNLVKKTVRDQNRHRENPKLKD